MSTKFSETEEFVQSTYYLSAGDGNAFMQLLYEVSSGADIPFQARNEFVKQEMDLRSAHLN